MRFVEKGRGIDFMSFPKRQITKVVLCGISNFIILLFVSQVAILLSALLYSKIVKAFYKTRLKCLKKKLDSFSSTVSKL